MADLLKDVDVNDHHHRWAYIPDSEGRMHLIDINPYDTPVEPVYIPANDVVFTLFTRSNPTAGQRITFDEATLISGGFNPNHPTRFTVHGWNGGPTNPVNVLTNREYFRHGDYNASDQNYSFDCKNYFFSSKDDHG